VDGWARVAEIAEELGIHDQLIRKLVHQGKIPASRLGDHYILVSREGLDSYLKSNPVRGPNPLRDGRRNGKKPGRRRILSITSNKKTGPNRGSISGERRLVDFQKGGSP